MKDFFIGFTHLEGSPCFVNKELLQRLPGHRYFTHYAGGGIRRRLSCYWGILRAKKIVISGIFLSRSEVKLIKLLRKKFLYLMHGSYFMEAGMHHSTAELVQLYSNRIVSVSKVHAQLIRDEYPQYTDKIVVWYNGINWEEVLDIRREFDVRNRDPRKIILFGGGRFMKGNLAVCRAVEQLNAEKGLDLHVDVYGTYSAEDDSKEIANIKCVNYKPLIARDRINHELAKGNLFIANSKFDTFNLALMDAIGVGCNVLFSGNVGAKDVIPGKTDADVINDVENINELKAKIENVLSVPNNQRLFASIDKDATGWEARAREFDNLVRNL